MLDGKNRSDLQAGLEVDIVLKKDQPTGKLTRGIIQDILTNSAYHPRGIKVRLTDGRVGRVQNVLSAGLSGKKLWDAIVEMRGCSSIHELSKAFHEGRVMVDGKTVDNPEHLIEDGHHIVRIGTEHSVDLYVGGGIIDKARSKVMR